MEIAATMNMLGAFLVDFASLFFFLHYSYCPLKEIKFAATGTTVMTHN